MTLVEHAASLERLAPEVVDVLADDVRILNEPHADGAHGGGDVDCVIRGARPNWPLRLTDWRLCQALRYDVASTYYVLVRGEETLALDVVDDPRGIGKYAFSTALAFADDGEPGALAAPHVRAAYLTVKRIWKGQTDGYSWHEVAELAASDPAEYERVLARSLGPELARELEAYMASGVIPCEDTVAHWRKDMFRRRARSPRRMLRRAWGRS